MSQAMDTVEPGRAHAVVVGGGVCALMTALDLLERGVPVSLCHHGSIHHELPHHDGLAAPLPGEPARRAHREDALQHAAGLAVESMVRCMVDAASAVTQRLRRLAVPVDLDPGGTPQRYRAGGHREARLLSAGGRTGALVHAALRAALQPFAAAGRLTVHQPLVVLDVPTADDGAVAGVVALDLRRGAVVTVPAAAVVVAADAQGGHQGWLGGMRCGPAPLLNALLETGVGLVNPDLVAFHPFGLSSGSPVSGVVPEDLLVHGARWAADVLPPVSDTGRGPLCRAMAALREKGDPVPELVVPPPRREGALAAWQLLQEQGRMEGPHLALRVSPVLHLPTGGLAVHAPGHGAAPLTTQVRGLLAAGECADSPHGADVMAGHSLLWALSSAVLAAGSAQALLAQPGAHAQPLGGVLLRGVDRVRTTLSGLERSETGDGPAVLADELAALVRSVHGPGVPTRSPAQAREQLAALSARAAACPVSRPRAEAPVPLEFMAKMWLTAAIGLAEAALCAAAERAETMEPRRITVLRRGGQTTVMRGAGP